DGFLLDAFLGNREREMNHIVASIADRSAGVSDPGYRSRRRGQHADLKRIQTFPCVAVAKFRQMAPRVTVHLYVVISEAALFVCQRAIYQLLQLLDAERLESKNLRARHERAVHVEERIVSGRTDEAKVSSFDIGQKDVLLRLVEMMNLINKEDRLLPGCAETITGRGEHPAHFGDVAFHPANPNKFGMGHLRDHAR